MIILAQSVSITMNYSDALLENILLVYSILLYDYEFIYSTYFEFRNNIFERNSILQTFANKL